MSFTFVAFEVCALGDFARSAWGFCSKRIEILTGECLLDIDQLEVFKHQVLRIAEAATTSVRWKSLVHSGPSMLSLVQLDWSWHTILTS
jgi:hypothetical protein